jgi:hypothetical protein
LLLSTSALAPFLLLRTHQSTKYTLFILERLEHISKRLPNVVSSVIVVTSNLFFIPVVKILATLISIFSNIPEHILAIPYNFYKYVFTVDFLRSPQVISEEDQIYDLDNYPMLLPDFNNVYDIPKLIITQATEKT